MGRGFVSRLLRFFVMLVVGVVVAVLVGCSGMGETPASEESVPTAMPTLVATVAPASTETVEATAAPTSSQLSATPTAPTPAPTPSETARPTQAATPSGPTQIATVTPSSPGRYLRETMRTAEDGDGLRLQREYVPAVFGTRPQPR